MSSPDYFEEFYQCYIVLSQRRRLVSAARFWHRLAPHERLIAAASKSLLLSRRFAPLFWCQFFSAFSDNFLKNALAFLIVFHIGGSLAELTQLAAAVFIAPYFFLSRLAARWPTATTKRSWRGG